MKIIIGPIIMPVKHKKEDVINAAQEIVRQSCILAENFYIYKQSVDARRKNNIHYVYSVLADTNEEICPAEKIRPFEEIERLIITDKIKLNNRPVVAGMGPCGLFAAYVLALSGNPPIVIERGEDVDKRAETVKEFWNGGRLNPESNVQFGEGGAGTFSDGKLNTRIGDKRQRFVLETFNKFGAPEDILYRAKPHIGTDKLRDVVRAMREEIIRLGGEVRFSTCLTGIKTDAGKMVEIELNYTENIPCEKLVLAIGHSSRDTYKWLDDMGVYMEQKPFAAGVRIEHKQSMIDNLQYGERNSGLPVADYRLVYNGKDRSCYSFCMCPGGTVVNASSETDMLVVNGMSEHNRDGENANSALVVSVRPEDFGSDDVLAGVEFQRKYERLAYELGGGDGTAPIQLARDFLAQRKSDKLGNVKPSFTGRWRFAELDNCLPDFICEYLRLGLLDFEKKMKGFASGDGILTGVEMRTSAPVKIVRDENLESVSISGLYPAGEGAGYAGGIVSAAVDGIRVALEIIK